MLRFNILQWCDDKITALKNNNISFKNGIPQLPREYVYTEKPLAVSTFKYRNDIPTEHRSKGLLTFFMFEPDLWPRLTKIDTEIPLMREYGGIAGFDLSPCVTMLRARQRLSILVNAIYSCYCGINGIKILPNYRAGDLGTVNAANYFPDDCSFMIGNLGCSRNGYRLYGEYQLDILLMNKSPEVLYVYGSLSKGTADRYVKNYGLEIISFPDRRNRIWNGSLSYRYFLSEGKVVKEVYYDVTLKGGAA